MDTTIIVPTRNEADNVEHLVWELYRHLPSGCEVLFVDDSDDETTVAAIQLVSDELRGALVVRYIHRPIGERVNSIAGAVMHALAYIDSAVIVVMDGDLQHPPDTVPDLIDMAHHADVVVASRYIPGGNANGLNGPVRHLVSRASTWVAKGMFPQGLAGVTDPMTGFFAVRREVLQPDRMQPTGFKILLEVLLRHRHLDWCEVPVQFAERNAGTSKSTMRQGMTYLRHLVRLRMTVRTVDCEHGARMRVSSPLHGRN